MSIPESTPNDLPDPLDDRVQPPPVPVPDDERLPRPGSEEALDLDQRIDPALLRQWVEAISTSDLKKNKKAKSKAENALEDPAYLAAQRWLLERNPTAVESYGTLMDAFEQQRVIEDRLSVERGTVHSPIVDRSSEEGPTNLAHIESRLSEEEPTAHPQSDKKPPSAYKQFKALYARQVPSFMTDADVPSDVTLAAVSARAASAYAAMMEVVRNSLTSSRQQKKLEKAESEAGRTFTKRRQKMERQEAILDGVADRDQDLIAAYQEQVPQSFRSPDSVGRTLNIPCSAKHATIVSGSYHFAEASTWSECYDIMEGCLKQHQRSFQAAGIRKPLHHYVTSLPDGEEDPEGLIAQIWGAIRADGIDPTAVMTLVTLHDHHTAPDGHEEEHQHAHAVVLPVDHFGQVHRPFNDGRHDSVLPGAAYMRRIKALTGSADEYAAPDGPRVSRDQYEQFYRGDLEARVLSPEGETVAWNTHEDVAARFGGVDESSITIPALVKHCRKVTSVRAMAYHLSVSN